VANSTREIRALYFLVGSEMALVGGERKVG
jgi:hypothetical protein